MKSFPCLSVTAQELADPMNLEVREAFEASDIVFCNGHLIKNRFGSISTAGIALLKATLQGGITADLVKAHSASRSDTNATVNT